MKTSHTKKEKKKTHSTYGLCSKFEWFLKTYPSSIVFSVRSKLGRCFVILLSLLAIAMDGFIFFALVSWEEKFDLSLWKPFPLQPS